MVFGWERRGLLFGCWVHFWGGLRYGLAWLGCPSCIGIHVLTFQLSEESFFRLFLWIDFGSLGGLGVICDLCHFLLALVIIDILLLRVNLFFHRW